jgi:two-component system phosphate regulon sensor histidine kinase PhoR
MAGTSRPRFAAWLWVAAQLVLLAVLATLQFRWTGEVSRAERERMRAGLEVAAARFAADLDRELTRALLFFLPAANLPTGPEGSARETVRLLERWRETAPYPELVEAVWEVREDGSGPPLRIAAAPSGEVMAQTAVWPPELQPVRRRLESLEGPGGPPRSRRRAPGLREPRPPLLVPDAAALVLPHFGRREPSTELLILQLDRAYLRDEFLPRLGERYFDTRGGPAYALEVRLAGGSGRRIFASGPPSPGSSGPEGGDVEVDLFALSPPEELRGLWRELRRERLWARERPGGEEGWEGLSPEAQPEPRPGMRPGPWMEMRPGLRPGPPAGLGAAEAREGGWKLVVRHPEGSLEAAVRRVRWRNLAVSFGVLLLLGLTLWLLLLSGRRAQRLAAQQVELVAGITHELRTPVAAIESLGQNLADGIVRGEEQVRRYGSLIRSEGERLERLVDQVLELAGILSGKRAHAAEPTDLAAVVEGAAADHRALLDEEGFTLDLDVAPDLPPLEADPAALRRAVGNLIHNAVKYGGRKRWVGVRARPSGRGDEVILAVEDRGPGVPRDDLPHLFEPFYRGSNATAAQIQGSGLGLSLVRHVAERHGGRVEVRDGAEGGSVFEIHLPIHPPAASRHPGGEGGDPETEGGDGDGEGAGAVGRG